MGNLIRKILWTDPARFDQRRLRTWVERYSPQKARAEGQRLREAIEHLTENPRLGRRIAPPGGGEEELRELIVLPYVVRYLVTDDAVVIVRLWHGRENRPANLDG